MNKAKSTVKSGKPTVLTLPKEPVCLRQFDGDTLVQEYTRATYASNCFAVYYTGAEVASCKEDEEGYGLEDADWAKPFFTADMLADLRDYAMLQGWKKTKWLSRRKEMVEEIENLNFYRVLYSGEPPSFAQLLSLHSDSPHFINYMIRFGAYRYPVTSPILNRKGVQIDKYINNLGAIEHPGLTPE